MGTRAFAILTLCGTVVLVSAGKKLGWHHHPVMNYGTKPVILYMEIPLE